MLPIILNLIGFVGIALSAEPQSVTDGARSAKEWERGPRPRLLSLWTDALGKVEPAPADLVHFPDIRQARELKREELPRYTRIELELPAETGYWQPHLLLIPKGFRGKRPAVVAWTSTTPDWRKPEEWWGAWLAERGYVVLTGWSFIRQYRGGATYSSRVNEAVYERFGYWAPISKMVWDARRQYQYLKSLPNVDSRRVGFMGFSLSAKTAVYAAAFAPEFAAIVSLDPCLPLGKLPEGGGTNWEQPWYLDWDRHSGKILAGHDHHELIALGAPRPFLLIAGSADTEWGRAHSDGRATGRWIERAREVYRLYHAGDRLQFVPTRDGHSATGAEITPAWQTFFEKWLGGKR